MLEVQDQCVSRFAFFSGLSWLAHGHLLVVSSYSLSSLHTHTQCLSVCSDFLFSNQIVLRLILSTSLKALFATIVRFWNIGGWGFSMWNGVAQNSAHNRNRAKKWRGEKKPKNKKHGNGDGNIGGRESFEGTRKTEAQSLRLKRIEPQTLSKHSVTSCTTTTFRMGMYCCSCSCHHKAFISFLALGCISQHCKEVSPLSSALYSFSWKVLHKRKSPILSLLFYL